MNVFCEAIASYKVPRGWLYTPSTYLVDSWVPFVEEIYLPEVYTKKGQVALTLNERGITKSDKGCSMKSKLKSFFLRKDDLVIDGQKNVVLDFRRHSPDNLAHAITNHLPLALYVRGYLEKNKLPPVLLIFPTMLPTYIQEIFSAAGFDFVLTAATVKGLVCEYKVEPWIALRGVRHTIIKEGMQNTEFSEIVLQHGAKLAKKIFISRRDTRCLKNELEVEDFLDKRGYQKIYLEDFNIMEQIAIVSCADSIVSIHGAALGSLLFRALFNTCPIRVVEIFSPGHMTNVYRVITHQVGGDWVGVRGKLWPKIVSQAYRRPQKAHRFAYDDFELCLISLEKAMRSIDL